jgi:hypothetical protein
VRFAFRLGVLTRDHLVEPIAQAVLRPCPAALRAASPVNQARVEQAGIGIDLNPEHAAVVSLMWKESAPAASDVAFGTAVLMIRDVQFLYSLGENQVEVSGGLLPVSGPWARVGRSGGRTTRPANRS